ncbi:hypothetical protein E2C01_008869 [Portunus trituberculatus]|uniref:Uncharacterized protein n=1 Tax=Portunus trituberculatus TaxID=210409 RepID=A0A5B7D1Y6_PORTR|nr:hypothetical protein [Portunus trituberculatus]
MESAQHLHINKLPDMKKIQEKTNVGGAPHLRAKMMPIHRMLSPVNRPTLKPRLPFFTSKGSSCKQQCHLNMLDGSCTHPDDVNYCCDKPRQTQTQEHIDRVTARHIPHSIVGVFLLHRCGLGGEGVGQRRSQGNKGHFHGEELGDLLSEHLASILNLSLRCRSSSGSVKQTCDRIKLPNNVLNLKVPVTNSAITKAMSIGAKLVDTWLSLTNGLLVKALVPIARCISNIGDRHVQPITCYLEGINNSFRLLVSTVNYINQLRKDVARIHVNDSALEEFCKWECEVGQDDLFPFDIVKKSNGSGSDRHPGTGLA